MAKVDKFKLMDFYEEPKMMHSVLVPQGAKLLRCKALSDGIYLWYEIPSIEMGMMQQAFTILGANAPIPADTSFVELVDVVMDNEQGEQNIVIFPVYKFNDKKIL